MTSERTMNAPKGHQKTEVGVLPSDWDIKQIDDVCHINLGSLKSSTDPEYELNYIDIASIEKTGCNPVRTKVLFKEAPSRARRIVKGDNILVSTVRPNLRGFTYIDDAENNLICSTGFAVLESKNNNVLRYIYQFILSNLFLNQIIPKLVGSNYPAINTNDLSIVKIPIPPLPEQRKIASILSKVDEHISHTEAIIEKTEELKKGLMQQLLTKGIGHTKFKKTEIGEIPEEWDVVKQGDVATFYNGRAYKLTEWEKTGTPVIRLQNLTGTGSEFYYSTLNLPEKQYASAGDLLYMWSASFGPYIWNGPRAIYHYHIWKIECGDRLDKLFMYYMLNNVTDMLKRSMHGMAILHITKDKMEKQKIPLPSYSEQQKIASILSKVDDQLSQNQTYLSHLQELKKGLMQDLLTGKVRVKIGTYH